MDLAVQIQSFVFSFAFGFLFSYGINLGYKYLFTGKVLKKIICNFIFVIGSCLLYFISMKAINHAVIHIYFIMMVVIGVLLGNFLNRKIRRL